MVEVVYALPKEQSVVRLVWRAGFTAGQAVSESGLLARYPEAARTPLVLGRFGARIDDSAALQPGDRVEICRPLLADPRELRRELAGQGRVVGFKSRE